MEKSPEAFRTISEVAELLETPAHVLRFWESRFPQIRPVKRAGGRRYYRPSDVALLSGIKRLLHEDGLTIRGVQKILQEQGVKHVAGLIDEEAEESLAAEVEAAPAEPIPLFPARPAEDAPKITQGALFDSLPENPSPESATRDGGTGDDAPLSRAETVATDMPVDGDPAPVSEDMDAADASTDAPTPEASAFDQVAATDPVPAEDAPPAPMADSSPSDAPPLAEDGGGEVAPPPATANGAELPPPEPAAKAEPESGESAPHIAAATPTAAETEPVAESAPTASDAPPSATSEPRAEGPSRWMASDLRAMRATALHGKADRAEALAQRLRALRERLGSAGRPPVR
jgi:DNA-binding transcriptional MerR regulator